MPVRITVLIAEPEESCSEIALNDSMEFEKGKATVSSALPTFLIDRDWLAG